jgi:hypothetical protein
MQSALFSASGRPPGYVQVALTTDAHDAYTANAGHWEYRYHAGIGPVMHVRTDLLIPANGRALAFSFEDTDFNWHADEFVWNVFLASFLWND